MAGERDQRPARPASPGRTADQSAGSVSDLLMSYAQGGSVAPPTEPRPGAPALTGGATVAELLRQGVAAFQAGQLAAAEQAFTEVLRDDPSEPMALQLLGVIAYQSGQGEDAVQLIEAALEIKPDYVEAYYNLGRVLAGLGQLDQAEARLRQALELRPAYREASLELANLLQRRGRIADALAACKGLLAEDDSFPEGHLNTANLLAELDRSEEAYRHYQRAISLRPGYAVAHSNLADLLKAQGALTAAVAEYRKAVDAAPDDVEIELKLREALSRLIPKWHFTMLNDGARNDAFDRAIGRAVAAAGADAVVLDIGTGTGLLAMMAARAGANRIYACEMIKPLAETAAQIVQRNRYADRITVVARKSTDLKVGDDLPEPAGLIIAELFDGGLLGEGVIPSLRHAIANLAAPGAAVLPAGATALGVLVECPDLRGINPVGQICGFDLADFDQFRNPATYKRFNMEVEPHRPLTDVFEIARFDFRAPPPADVARQLDLTATETGTGHAVVFWFDLHLDAETTLSTGRGSPHNHWGQAIQFLDRDLAVAAGQPVPLVAGHSDTQFRFRAG